MSLWCVLIVLVWALAMSHGMRHCSWAMMISAADYQTRIGLEFTPSHFQVDVFDWVLAGRGHAVVKAVAGAGKSETVKCVVRLLTVPTLVLAFNVDVKDENIKRLAGTKGISKTVHGHGMGTVCKHARGKVVVDKNKYRKMVDAAAEAIGERGGIKGLPAFTSDQRAALKADGLPVDSIVKLINFAQLDVVNIDGPRGDFDDRLLKIADMHAIDDHDPCLDSLVADIVHRCMWVGSDMWETINYTDMIWLPVVNGWTPSRYAWICIDECQDISRCALALIRRSLYSGGRTVWVGDPAQAIYSFAGANPDSFWDIIEVMDATVLPLDVCYRCPTSVLDVAREYVPEIQARPGAPVGVVRGQRRADYIADAQPGKDLILCWRNAPLLTMFFALLSEGIPAKVRGRDIAEGLVNAIEQAGAGRPYPMLGAGIDAWEAAQVEVARKRAKDAGALASRMESIGDKAECMRVIYSRTKATSVDGLAVEIRAMFSDDKDNDAEVVTLSSIHRAKGDQSERVIIIEHDLLVNPPARRGVDQSKNLAYVAFTRAKREMIYLDVAFGDAVYAPPTPKTIAPVVESAWQAPPPLPTVDTDAPDAYDPDSQPSRVALARTMDNRLRYWGFRPVQDSGVSEVVYARLAGLGGIECRVYSTIVGAEVRGCGEDSIKVSLVGPSGDGLGKSKRVNRVGDIADIVGRVRSRISSLRK